MDGLRRREAFVTDDARWERHLVETTAFATEHGRFPLHREGGKWLAEQRRAARQGRLSEHRWLRLDKLLPGWQLSTENRWWARLREVEAFIDEHQRRPRASAHDHHEAELGRWLEMQVSGAGRALHDPTLSLRLQMLRRRDETSVTFDTFTVAPTAPEPSMSKWRTASDVATHVLEGLAERRARKAAIRRTTRTGRD